MRTSMNISLPKSLRSWVEEQVEQRGYGTASEFVRELLRKEQIADERGRINQFLLESMKGPSRPITPELWESIQSKGMAKAKRLKDK